ncbi:APC family permease [Tunturiibacter gelidoferens]|nr:APC family permease [Edaphobacter lichenicola]
MAVLTYIGFDGISTLSDEAQDPARTIPRAIILTCLIKGLLGSVEVDLAQLMWPRGAAFPDLDTAYVAVAQRAGGTFLFVLMNGALLIATIESGMASQLGTARLLFAMGQNGALPRRFFGTLNPVRRIPQNNLLLIGVSVLIGSRYRAVELWRASGLHGCQRCFSSSGVAYEGLKPWLPILLSGSGFVVCFFLWLNLGPTARWAGTAWAVLGIALWLVRRNQMTADKQFTGPS